MRITTIFKNDSWISFTENTSKINVSHINITRKNIAQSYNLKLTRSKMFCWYCSSGVQPEAHGRMQPRMARNAAQHKIVIYFFCSSVFVNVCVFNMWPKTTIFLTVWPRDAKSLDTLTRDSHRYRESHTCEGILTHAIQFCSLPTLSNQSVSLQSTETFS